MNRNGGKFPKVGGLKTKLFFRLIFYSNFFVLTLGTGNQFDRTTVWFKKKKIIGIVFLGFFWRHILI